MSNPLFRIISLEPEGLHVVRTWPPSRRRALDKTLREGCLLFDPQTKVPPHYRRLMIPATVTDQEVAPLNLEIWEQELIGESVFGSTIEQQGPGVLKVLHPVLQSCRILSIVDPYLVSWTDSHFETKGFKALLESAKPGLHIQSISCLGFKNDRKEPGRHHRRLKQICRWLAETPFDFSSLKMYLYAINRRRDERYGIHDRFYCFQQSTESQDRAMALSIGYGVGSFLTEKHNRTCLARISSRHFLNVWNSAERQADWLIRVGQDDLSVGNHFQPLSHLRRRTKMGHHLTVFEYRPPRD